MMLRSRRSRHGSTVNQPTLPFVDLTSLLGTEPDMPSVMATAMPAASTRVAATHAVSTAVPAGRAFEDSAGYDPRIVGRDQASFGEPDPLSRPVGERLGAGHLDLLA